MKVRLTTSARLRLLEIVEYLHERRPAAAMRFLSEAEKAFSRLERYPESGRTVPEFGRSSFREVLVQPYRIFYKITGSEVWIIDLWHDAQIPDDPTD